MNTNCVKLTLIYSLILLLPIGCTCLWYFYWIKPTLDYANSFIEDTCSAITVSRYNSICTSRICDDSCHDIDYECVLATVNWYLPLVKSTYLQEEINGLSPDVNNGSGVNCWYIEADPKDTFSLSKYSYDLTVPIVVLCFTFYVYIMGVLATYCDRSSRPTVSISPPPVISIQITN